MGSGTATSGGTSHPHGGLPPPVPPGPPNPPGKKQEETESTADSPVAAAAEELYGADPEAFTGRRGELAAAARDAGDKAAAKAITALRKPTRAAWVVNQLARADPNAPGRLAELATALRAAQEAKDGRRLRELSAARGALVDALAAQALAVAGVTDPAASLRLEVAETLTAAIADPEVAADFAAGTLTRAVQWSGFGLPPATAEPGEAAGARAQDAAARGATAANAAARSRASSAPAGRAGRGAGAGQVVRADPAAAAREAARWQAELDERLAREAAEQAARRREQYEEAERLVADSAAATAEAVGAEDRLEAEVRDLEQRLTQARADLAAARMRARRAEAGERRARQARDRLFGL